MWGNQESIVNTARALVNTPFSPLVERIQQEATVENDRILKIDHFLNHRIEPAFMAAMGNALAERIAPFKPDLLLTAEASGIAPALATAMALDLPLVYAKKYAPIVEPPALSRIVPSPTKGGETRLVVGARYLPSNTRVALVDDFLANGRTALALAEIIGDAGAETVVAGFLVEKMFQQGRTALEERRIPIVALAQVARLEAGRVIMAEA
ncbi:MAG: xanthine phosphoribosyltransferase [Chloroflexi bacterium]|nr:MAG: xanthine phosphoribosyltransferase [Chloroflexota bacterium]